MKKIKLYYGPGKYLNNNYNFGDSIAPILMEEITGRKWTWASAIDCEAISIGSLIQRLTGKQWKRFLRGNCRPVHVFGSGFIKERKRPDFSMNMIFHAVRGPITRDRLNLPLHTPLGDPGVLFDRLIGKNCNPQYRVGIIPHFVDWKNDFIQHLHNELQFSTIINIGEHPLDVLRQINNCEVIISTSLHGLIAADSYHKPNYRIYSSNKPVGGDYKFIDYWGAVGRNSDCNYIYNADLEKLLIDSYDKNTFQYFENIDNKKTILEKALNESADLLF